MYFGVVSEDEISYILTEGAFYNLARRCSARLKRSSHVCLHFFGNAGKSGAEDKAAPLVLHSVLPLETTVNTLRTQDSYQQMNITRTSCLPHTLGWVVLRGNVRHCFES